MFATFLARNACLLHLARCSQCALKMHPEPALTGVDISFKNGRFVRGVSKNWAARKCGAAAWAPRCKHACLRRSPSETTIFGCIACLQDIENAPCARHPHLSCFDTPHAKPLLLRFSRAQNKAPATVRHELDVGRHCWIFGFQDGHK